MPRLFVLIPAHNEADGIGKTLDSLVRQTVRPAQVVVVADNCTDQTVAIARGRGVRVFETIDNTDKKAGALNQALAKLLPALADTDKILVMDADSTLNTEFVANALATFARDARIGAVSSTFFGEPGGGFVGLLQRMEYVQYAFEIRRRKDTLVLSGTATVFRVDVLRQVAQARQETLPGHSGVVYNLDSITEDNELTLAIKTLGWRCVQPEGCDVLTEVMPTWRDLWKQRLRWKRGTIQDIKLYGLNKVTLPYLGQQLELAVSVFARVLIFVMATTMIGGAVEWHPIWTVAGLVFVILPVISVRKMGAGPMLIAAAVLPQLVYRMFQELVLLVSYYEIYLGIEAKWHHLGNKEGASVVRNWWRSRSRSRNHRHTGLHGSEHRVGDRRRVHTPVPRAGAVPAFQAESLEQGQVAATRVLAPIDGPTKILPAIGTLSARVGR